MTPKYTDPERSKLIKEEIQVCYTPEELLFFESFEEFWDEIDKLQTYEEEREAEKAAWKPFYRSNFKKLRGEVA